MSGESRAMPSPVLECAKPPPKEGKALYVLGGLNALAAVILICLAVYLLWLGGGRWASMPAIAILAAVARFMDGSLFLFTAAIGAIRIIGKRASRREVIFLAITSAVNYGLAGAFVAAAFVMT